MEERLTTAGVAYRNGEFLVARREKGGPLSEKWEFVGGKNRWGETIEESLEREWKEELDLDISPREYLCETEFINGGVHYTLKCHRVEIIGGNIRLKVHEDVKWVREEELAKLDFGPSDSRIRDWILSHVQCFKSHQ